MYTYIYTTYINVSCVPHVVLLLLVVEEAAPLPAEVKRYMLKFTDSLKGAGLNRMKQAQVLAGVVDALEIDPKELMQLIQRVKRGM